MARKSNLITSYRTCFSEDAGKRVLAHLLIEAGYFDTDLKTPEEQAVLNFAKKIIANLGICVDPKDTSYFVDKLFELPVKGI